MSIGTVLKQLRLERNIPQQQLAQAVEADVRRVSLYENDKMIPSTEVLRRLANFFNVSVDYILAGQLDGMRKVYFSDQELLDLFVKADRLGAEDRQVIKAVIQAFLLKNKIKDISQLLT